MLALVSLNVYNSATIQTPGFITRQRYHKCHLEPTTLLGKPLLWVLGICSSSQTEASVSLLSAVLDVNDETPTFFPAVYNVSVSEDVPREYRVVWLNCTDNDVGLNAELSYFITGIALPA